jgi:hypothetical protein
VGATALVSCLIKNDITSSSWCKYAMIIAILWDMAIILNEIDSTSTNQFRLLLQKY